MKVCKNTIRRRAIKLKIGGFNTLLWSELWVIGLEGHLSTHAEGIIIEEDLNVINVFPTKETE